MSESIATRDAIVTAAVPVFGRHGYAKTSMDLLARAAGLSRPALYQYFANKADVFRAVAERVGADLQATALAAAGIRTTTADRLYDALVVKLDFASGRLEAEHRSELAREAAVLAREVVAADEARYAELIASVLAADPDLGLTVPPHDTATLLVDATMGVARSDAPAGEMHRRLRQLVDLVVRGHASSPRITPARRSRRDSEGEPR
jgi:AcrR family transcriptional regulator